MTDDVPTLVDADQLAVLAMFQWDGTMIIQSSLSKRVVAETLRIAAEDAQARADAEEEPPLREGAVSRNEPMEIARLRAVDLKVRISADMDRTFETMAGGTAQREALVNDAMHQVELLLGEIAGYEQRARILRGTGD